MLSMKKIQKVYRTDLIETHALHDFSIEVKTGEFVAVMGRSGSGKTTFLNIAGLLDTFDKGTYHLDGQDVSRLSDNEMSKIRNQKIGFIFQSFNLIPDLDVFDNVDVPLRYRRLPAAERASASRSAVEHRRASRALRHHLPSQLSGGQQQRVAIARVLGGRPEADPGRRAHRQPRHADVARGHGPPREDQREGTTIVMVTHTPECASRASRQIHLLDGEVVDLDALPAEAPGAATSPRASPRRCLGGGRHVAPQPAHRLEEPEAEPRALGPDRHGHRARHRGLDDVRHGPPRLRRRTRSRRRATSCTTSASTAGTR